MGKYVISMNDDFVNAMKKAGVLKLTCGDLENLHHIIVNSEKYEEKSEVIMSKPTIELSKEEVEYLLRCMDCLYDESSSEYQNYAVMKSKLDAFCRTNFGCFIAYRHELLDVSKEEDYNRKVKESEERLEYTLAKAHNGLSDASCAIDHMKSRMIHINAEYFEGAYKGPLFESMLKAAENIIRQQWNSIFAGYPEMENLIVIKIKGDTLPQSWVHLTEPLSVDDLDHITFPKDLLCRIDKIEPFY